MTTAAQSTQLAQVQTFNSQLSKPGNSYSRWAYSNFAVRTVEHFRESELAKAAYHPDGTVKSQLARAAYGTFFAVSVSFAAVADFAVNLLALVTIYPAVKRVWEYVRQEGPFATATSPALRDKINHYIETRNAYLIHGGTLERISRNMLRDDYLRTNIPAARMRAFIETLPPSVRAEFTHRIAEWDSKIAQKLLFQEKTNRMTEQEFFSRVNEYARNHRAALESPQHAAYQESHRIFKAAMNQVLANEPATQVVSTLRISGVTDSELLGRITYWND